MPPNNKQARGLSQKELQQIVLGILIAAFVLFAYWRFVLAPLRRTVQRLRTNYEKEDRVYTTNKTLAESLPILRERHRTAAERLNAALSDDLPPYENAAAWVGDLIIETAMHSPASVKVLSITGDSVHKFRRQKKQPPPMFEECLFRIELLAPYHDFGRFLAHLEKRAPYMRVDSLYMTRKARAESRRLEIELVCAFPRVTREFLPPERLPKLGENARKRSEADDTSTSAPDAP